jgi:hypothetical protein
MRDEPAEKAGFLIIIQHENAEIRYNNRKFTIVSDIYYS